MGVDVIDLGRLESRAAQRELHRAKCADAFGVRRSDVIGVATRAPATQPGQNRRSALPRGLFGLDYQNGRTLAQTHPRPVRIKWPATRGIHQHQRMKPAPGHARQRISPTREHHLCLSRLDHFCSSRDGQCTGRARRRHGHAWPE